MGQAFSTYNVEKSSYESAETQYSSYQVLFRTGVPSAGIVALTNLRYMYEVSFYERHYKEDEGKSSTEFLNKITVMSDKIRDYIRTRTNNSKPPETDKHYTSVIVKEYDALILDYLAIKMKYNNESSTSKR